MKRIIPLLVLISSLLVGCGNSSPKAVITSAVYVQSINKDGAHYLYKGFKNIKVTMDFYFTENMIKGLDPTSDDYREELYSILTKAIHFYDGETPIKLNWGYWPTEAGNNYAKDMSFFFVVPENHSDQLRLVFDGELLGDGGQGIDTIINP